MAEKTKNEQTAILTTKQFASLFEETTRLGKDRFCFILGAGASRSSGIATGNELELRWMDCLMGERDDRTAKKKNPEDTRRDAQELRAGGKLDFPFEEIEKAWQKAKKTKTAIPSKYYSDLYRLRFLHGERNGQLYLEREMEGKVPSIGYHALSLLLTKPPKDAGYSGSRNNLIITTNFDNLVEDALFLYTDQRPMVAAHESLARFIDLNRASPTVFKLHRGLFYDQLNTPTQGLAAEWKDALDDAIHRYIPVVVGYGGGDQSLMAYLKEKNTHFRNGFYWCYVGEGHPDGEIERLVREKGGSYVAIKGFDALMLELGTALFGGEDLTPTAAKAFFRRQMDARMDAYTRQYNDLRTEDPDTRAAAASVLEAERRAAKQREEKNELTAWDYFDRAYAAAEAGDYEKAVADYSKAIELKPDYALAYNNRGNAYGVLGKYELAIADSSKAIELKPDDALAYYNRGVTYYKIGKNELAVADYNKAIELKPDFAEAYNNRGYVYWNLGEKELAVADYSKAIELKPDLAEVYNNRGIAYRNLGEYELAVADCSKAIELKPDYALAYNNRALAYRALGKTELAQKDEAKARELEQKQ